MVSFLSVELLQGDRQRRDVHQVSYIQHFAYLACLNLDAFNDFKPFNTTLTLYIHIHMAH